MDKKLLLIDGHSITFRSFYGVPELTNSNGLHTNAIFGFINILFKLIDDIGPTHLAIAFDESAPTFRHKVYAEYKGTRKPMPPELKEQIPELQNLLRSMGIRIISIPGIEADDILGTLAKTAQNEGFEVALVSGDRDLLQIADDNITIHIPKTKFGKTTIEKYNKEGVFELYSVSPVDFISLKALMGDSSDNIPGVPKVGEKTAIKLMTSYGSIDNIYAHIDEITPPSIRESLKNNRDLADLSLFLATIKTDCELGVNLEELIVPEFYTEEAFRLIKTFEFKHFFNRFENVSNKAKAENPDVIIRRSVDSETFFDLISSLNNKNRISISLINDACLYGACIGYIDKDEKYCLDSCISLDFESEKFVKAVNNLLASYEGCISVFDLKRFYPVLGLDIEIKNILDIMLAAYLINPLKSDIDYQSLALLYFNEDFKSIKDITGKSSISELIMNDASGLSEYIQNECLTCLKTADILKNKLIEMNELSIYNDIELPLTRVLSSMELEGVLVRRDELNEFSNNLGLRLGELEKQIFVEAGEEFNIQSPKQLGEILFEKMEMPGGKKTKTGYSTAADVLEKLALDYPFVKLILEYRTLAKLKSTYADGLVNYISSDGRIHSHFNQTITATGRISSSDPNLQNIPIRTELGRELRKVFVPKDGCLLVDADYSQIELRLLAALSCDKELIESYKNADDIHRITASKVFGVPLEEVTDLQRRNAKAVNFGIVYGISSFGLSQDLSISRKEAQEYIENYFETYPGIKQYLDKAVEDAKNNGYSITAYGRRRPIPELGSSNFMQRSFGERVAMNAPIQGTAADVMKLAMIAVYNELCERNLKSRLILQVHDELVIEAYEDELEVVKELLVRNMESVSDFSVKLEASMEVGKNWFEAH